MHLGNHFFFCIGEVSSPSLPCNIKYTGLVQKALARFCECSRQSQAEGFSKSRNKIHQTWPKPLSRALYNETEHQVGNNTCNRTALSTWALPACFGLTWPASSAISPWTPSTYRIMRLRKFVDNSFSSLRQFRVTSKGENREDWSISKT